MLLNYHQNDRCGNSTALSQAPDDGYINPLTLELNIYSLAHHLCEMLIFYEPRRVTLGNTRNFVEE